MKWIISLELSIVTILSLLLYTLEQMCGKLKSICCICRWVQNIWFLMQALNGVLHLWCKGVLLYSFGTSFPWRFLSVRFLAQEKQELLLRFNLFTAGIHFGRLGKASDICLAWASVFSLIREVVWVIFSLQQLTLAATARKFCSDSERASNCTESCSFPVLLCQRWKFTFHLGSRCSIRPSLRMVCRVLHIYITL